MFLESLGIVSTSKDKRCQSVEGIRGLKNQVGLRAGMRKHIPKSNKRNRSFTLTSHPTCPATVGNSKRCLPGSTIRCLSTVRTA
eukprot:2062498-Rhodomonas_salina.1